VASLCRWATLEGAAGQDQTAVRRRDHMDVDAGGRLDGVRHSRLMINRYLPEQGPGVDIIMLAG
jgi:hypothetical protein